MQVSEVAKIVCVLAIAWYLRFKTSQRSLIGLIPPALLALVPTALVLVEPDLGKLLGRSAEYADYCMASLSGRAAPPALVSTIKLRQAGFGDYIDTEDMFAEIFAQCVDKKILPPPGA